MDYCPHCKKRLDEIADLSHRNLDQDLDYPIPEPGFDDFWDGVPHRIGKKPAMAQWKRQVLTHSPAMIIAAVTGYRDKEARRKREDGPAFQAHHPARWLRDQRFLDEIPQDPVPVPVPVPVPAPEPGTIQKPKCEFPS